jgi:hypothetical protein
MSIPLVRNNTKDAINTSIIAIKKNLERINSLLGLADSSEPDLSGLATKQELEDAVTEINNTIDEVETSLQPVDTVTSGNMHSVTSNAVNEAVSTINTKIDDIYHQGVKYGSQYDCNTLGEGVALINEEVANSPLKQGLTTRSVLYLATMQISARSNYYRFQIAVSYIDNELFVRTYTDSGWSSWVKIN